MNTDANYMYVVHYDILVSNNSTTDSACFSGFAKCKQGASSTTPSVSSVYNKLDIIDAGLNGISVVFYTEADYIRILITGLASTTLKWMSEIKIHRKQI
jgi:hypothetical protein